MDNIWKKPTIAERVPKVPHLLEIERTMSLFENPSLIILTVGCVLKVPHG